MTQPPVQPAHRLAERAEQQQWLVTGLWGEEAVGIIGGEPKCCKSFLALDLAVAVATGTAAGMSIVDLDVQVITAPSLRLDLDADRASLDETVANLKAARA